MYWGVSDEEVLILLAFYLVLCGIVALIAPSRGKRPGGAFLLSVVLTPVVGFLFVVLGRPENQRKCPYCGENIKSEAVVCRYCGRDVAIAAGPLQSFEQAKIDLSATGKRRIFNCGRCGKGVSLSWSKCNHCGAGFEAFPPVATDKVV